MIKKFKFQGVYPLELSYYAPTLIGLIDKLKSKGFAAHEVKGKIYEVLGKEASRVYEGIDTYEDILRPVDESEYITIIDINETEIKSIVNYCQRDPTFRGGPALHQRVIALINKRKIQYREFNNQSEN